MGVFCLFVFQLLHVGMLCIKQQVCIILVRKCIHAKAWYRLVTLYAAGQIYCCISKNRNNEIINAATAAFIISIINRFVKRG